MKHAEGWEQNDLSRDINPWLGKSKRYTICG